MPERWVSSSHFYLWEHEDVWLAPRERRFVLLDCFFAGVCPPLFGCIEVPLTLASEIAGRFFVCSRFRGSGRGVERAGREIISLPPEPYPASSRDRGTAECHRAIAGRSEGLSGA